MAGAMADSRSSCRLSAMISARPSSTARRYFCRSLSLFAGPLTDSMIPLLVSRSSRRREKGVLRSRSFFSISASHSLRKPKMSLPWGLWPGSLKIVSRAPQKSSSSWGRSGLGRVNASSTWSRIMIKGFALLLSWASQDSEMVMPSSFESASFSVPSKPFSPSRRR